MPPGTSHSNRTRILTLACLGLIVVEGFLALAWIFTQPADPDTTFLLGYSPVRWALAGVTLLLTGLAGALGLDLLRSVERSWRKDLARRVNLPTVLAAGSLGLLVLDHGTLMALASTDHTAVRAVFNRLLPVGVFLGLASLQILLAAMLAVKGRAGPDRRITRAAGLAWAGLILAGGLILLTRLGLDPVTNGWYEYGVPLAHQQILYLFYSTLLVLLAGLVIGNRLPFPPRAQKALDVGLVLAIWLAAVIVWSSMPVPGSWFSPKPFPPNHEVYPNSDALSYDVAAQGTLLGTAWSRGALHYKPLYVAILTLLHTVAGQDYTRVILLQTLLLALFPVSLYLLGRSLHSRLAGGLAGLAAILREYNQLSVASLTTLSNSKLMLSELPTALGISVLLVVLAAWLRSPQQRESSGQRPHLALLAGGMIGLLIQIRLQTILFLPALAVLFFILFGKRWRSSLAATGLVCLGLCLSAAPLALRNWTISGTLALEKPGYFERTLSYAYTPVSAEEDPTGLSAATPAGETAPGLGRTLVLTLHHFAHNTASALLVLPNGLGSGLGWTRLRDLQSLFWMDTGAAIRLPDAAWLLANLALVALGAAALWRRARWVGLLPALFFGAYNLSSALGGFSGQRFILPVDWVGYFYALTGLSWLAVTLLGLMGWNVQDRLPFWTQPSPTLPIRPSGRASRWKTIAVIGILLLAGGLLPLEEALIPIRYRDVQPSQARAELLHLAEAQLSPQEMSALQALLDQPGSEVLQGVALYPRAIASEELEAGILRYTGERAYPLLAYIYLGSEQVWVLQPLEGLDGVALPNGAEVLVAGTRGQGSFRAFATARLDGSSFLFHPVSKR